MHTATRDLPEVMDLCDVAAALKFSTAHVRRLVVAGALPGKRFGRRWLVRRVDLLAALAPADRVAAPTATVGARA